MRRFLIFLWLSMSMWQLYPAQEKMGVSVSGLLQIHADRGFTTIYGTQALLPEVRFWVAVQRGIEAWIGFSMLWVSGQVGPYNEFASAKHYFLVLGAALPLWPEQKTNLRVRAGLAKTWLNEEMSARELNRNAIGFYAAVDIRSRVDNGVFGVATVSYMAIRRSYESDTIRPGGFRGGAGLELVF